MAKRVSYHKPSRLTVRQTAPPRPVNDAMPGRKSKFTSDRRWRRFRAAFLAAHPLCSDCEGQGLVRAAAEVHHTVRRTTDDVAGDHWFDEAKCLGLCKFCHSARTARGE